MKRLLCLATALACALPCAAWADPAPFARRDDTLQIDEYEKRLWDAGEEFDRLILKTGLVEDDRALTGYLQSVLDRLFPDLKGSLRVRIMKSPALNAFALPNGSIYMNQGMLARFDNEAQLATVLAHEGSHFTHRHSMRIQDRRKWMSLIHLATSLLGLPYPWARDLLMLSSMFGYSREMETEADNEGFKRLKDAGYDVRESPKVFAELLREVQASGIKEPFFFATHPKLQDRIDNYKDLSGREPAQGEVGQRQFSGHVGATRLAILQADLELHRPMSVLAALDFGAEMPEHPPQAFHFLAEAFRQRGRPGDDGIAEVLYLHAIELLPDYAPPHFGLATLYYKRSDLEGARRHFQAYLKRAPQGAERGFAEQYLKRIDLRLTESDP